MKIKKTLVKLVYIGFGASFVGTVWAFSTFFLPVGSINGDIIYRYELNERLSSMQGNAVKNIAKDKAFFKAMEQLRVSITDQEIENELSAYEEKYGGSQELEKILLDTQGDIVSLKTSIRKSLLSEKARKYFAQEYQPSEQEIKEYYAQNAERYPAAFEEEKAKVTDDIRAEKGEQKFNQYLQDKEKDIVIKVY